MNARNNIKNIKIFKIAFYQNNTIFLHYFLYEETFTTSRDENET